MTKLSPFISKAEAARRRGLSRHVLYEKIQTGEIVTDEQGRVMRTPFEDQIKRLASIVKGEMP